MPILWSGSAPALSIRFAPSCWSGALRYGRGCVSGEAFSKGRDFAAWLGLVPRQISTGDRTTARYRSVAIATCASCSFRRRGVVLINPKSWQRHGLKAWIEAARKRLHRNVLAIALANKLARIAWSVLAWGRNFVARKTDDAAAQSV